MGSDAVQTFLQVVTDVSEERTASILEADCPEAALLTHNLAWHFVCIGRVLV